MDGISARTLPRAEDRRRIAALVERGWSLPGKAEHPLGALQARALGGFRLLLLLGPKNAVGARYLQLFLLSAQGRLADEPLLLGLHNSGPFPAYNWVDVIRYEGAATFGDESLTLADGGRERRLFRLLGDLIPPGGHLMVEYESPYHRPTERLLAQGVPPVATPLGYLMFLSGCGASFRDWYISEGGREGPRKLQGFRPLDAEDAARKAAAMADELRAYLSRSSAPPPDPSRVLAHRVLRAIARSS